MRSFFRQAATILSLMVAALLFGQQGTLGPPTSGSWKRISPSDRIRPEPASPRVNVIALLSDPPLIRALIAARPANAARKHVPWTAAQQQAYSAGLRRQQAAVIGSATSLGARTLAQLTNSVNGVVFEIDRSRAASLARISGVTAVMKVADSQLLATVPETAAFVGATNLHNRIPGIDGTGVRVAVLDSGIDYTHRNLGGAGTVAAYQTAYGVVANGCAPTAANTGVPVFTSKVIGGFDFVGEEWPNAPLAPDPNPIDCQGHGTAVADILAGRSADRTWKGVAPGSRLYAVKVCSAVNSSCSGIAVFLGLDFALDPNGDGNVSDAVDIINMSLGSEYGQRENPLAFAVQNVVAFGVVTALAAGNSGDASYIVDSPSSAPEAISVAQTQASDAFTYPLILNPPVVGPSCSGSLCTNTAWQPWSETLASDVTGPLFIPATNADGCAPFATGALAGYVALIQRGTCNASLKTSNASVAGAVAVVIDNDVAGDPPVFGFGGGDPPLRTTIAITQQLGSALRAVPGTPVAGGRTVAMATISKTQQLNFSGSIVSSSSRGPNNGYTGAKPDIAAPGASVAAVVGTGSGTTAFSGTSGATPVIAGAAALLLQANPAFRPLDVKARLMNTSVTNILTNPAAMPGVLAPISRIGGGEVRVDRAFDSGSAMWDASNPEAVSLTFGYHAATSPQIFRKRIVVRNYNSNSKTYAIAATFRYSNDQAGGGVTFSSPGSITVPANSSSIFTLTMSVDPTKLPVWSATGINSGSQSANGALLQEVEFDGYLTLTAGSEMTTLPWHILPRASHNAIAVPGSFNGTTGTFNITNPGGAVVAPFDIFSLTGASPRLPPPAFPFPGEGFQTVDLRAAGIRAVNLGTAPGVWGGSAGVQIGVSTYDLPTHANTYPQILVLVDTNADGVDDWEIFNNRTTTNENAVFLRSRGACTPAPCPATGYFFTIVDLNSSNFILTIPASPVYAGAVRTVVPTNTPFRFTVLGVDVAFTGDITDVIPPMIYQLNLARFLPVGFVGAIPPSAILLVDFIALPGGAAASPSQSGFLVLYRDGQPQKELSTVVVP